MQGVLPNSAAYARRARGAVARRRLGGSLAAGLGALHRGSLLEVSSLHGSEVLLVAPGGVDGLELQSASEAVDVEAARATEQL